MAGAQGMGLGLSIPDVAGRARGSPDPAAAALIARMSGAPGEARAGLIDAAVRAIKAAGVWAKLDLLYLLAAHDAQAARLNWIGASNTLTAVNSPGFTVDRGYAGDGATSYLSTGWLPSTGVQHQLDSAALGCWLNAGTDSANNGAVAMGCTTGTEGSVLVARGTAGNIRGRVNALTSGEAGPAGGTRLGFTVLSRTASNVTTGYRNGVSAGSLLVSGSPGPSVARPAQALYLGGNNGNGSFGSGSDNRLAAAFAGAGLSAGEVAALHAALSAYLSAVGGA